MKAPHFILVWMNFFYNCKTREESPEGGAAEGSSAGGWGLHLQCTDIPAWTKNPCKLWVPGTEQAQGMKLTTGLILPPKVMDIPFSRACPQLLVLREERWSTGSSRNVVNLLWWGAWQKERHPEVWARWNNMGKGKGNNLVEVASTASCSLAAELRKEE